MSLFSRLVGDASEISPEEAKEELQNVLVEDEEVEASFILIRDLIVFTSLRLLLVDKQGITGKRTEYLSIPYQSIYQFSITTAGHFDIDSELLLYIAGSNEPRKIEIKSGDAILKIQKLLITRISPKDIQIPIRG